MLERDYREKMPHKIVEQVLRTGIFTASGKPVDYSHEVEEALAPLRSATLNLLSEKWQRGTTVDVIYLSGGGAELVYEQVVEAYPQTKLVPGRADGKRPRLSALRPFQHPQVSDSVSRRVLLVSPMGCTGKTHSKEREEWQSARRANAATG